MSAKVVGSAFVKIHAITSGLNKEIKKGIEDGIKGADIDELVNDELDAAAKKSSKAAKDLGTSVGDDIGDGVVEGVDTSLGNSDLRKSFKRRIDELNVPILGKNLGLDFSDEFKSSLASISKDLDKKIIDSSRFSQVLDSIDFRIPLVKARKQFGDFSDFIGDESNKTRKYIDGVKREVDGLSFSIKSLPEITLTKGATSQFRQLPDMSKISADSKKVLKDALDGNLTDLDKFFKNQGEIFKAASKRNRNIVMGDIDLFNASMNKALRAFGTDITKEYEKLKPPKKGLFSRLVTSFRSAGSSSGDAFSNAFRKAFNFGFNKFDDDVDKRTKRNRTILGALLDPKIFEGITEGFKSFGESIGKFLPLNFLESLREAFVVIIALVPLIVNGVLGAVAVIGTLVNAVAGLGVVALGLLGSVALGVGAVALAFAVNTPALENFKKRATEIADEFRTIGVAAQAQLLPKLLKAFKGLTVLIKPLEEFAFAAGSAVGDAALEISGFLSTLGKTGELTKILEGAGTVFRDVTKILVSGVRIATTAFGAALPVAQQFSDLVRGIFERFSAKLQVSASTGKLQETFQRLYDTAILVGGAIVDFGIALLKVLDVADRTAGQGFFKNFREFAAKFRDFTSSLEGQNKIADVFKGADAVLRSVGRLLKDVFKLVFEASTADVADNALVKFFDYLRNVALPFIVNSFIPKAVESFKRFSDSAGKIFGAVLNIVQSVVESPTFPILIDLFVKLAEVIAVIASSPGLQQILSTFAALAIVFATLKKTFGPLVSGLESVFKAVNKALGPEQAISASKFSAAMAGITVAITAGVVIYDKLTESSRRYKEEVKALIPAMEQVVEGTKKLGEAIGETISDDLSKILVDAGLSFDDVTKSIRNGGDALDPLRAKVKALGVDLNGFDVGKLDDVGDPVALKNFADALGISTGAAKKLVEQLEDVDGKAQDAAESALALAVKTGDITAAERDLAIERNTNKDGDVNFARAAEELGIKRKEAADKTNILKSAEEELANARRAAADPAFAALRAQTAYADATERLTDLQNDSSASESDRIQAAQAQAEAFLTLEDALGRVATAAEAGGNPLGAINSIINDLIAQNPQLKGTYDELRNKIIATTGAVTDLSINTENSSTLLAGLGNLEVQPKVDKTYLDFAYDKAASLNTELDETDGKTVTANVKVNLLAGAVSDFQRALGPLFNAKGKAKRWGGVHSFAKGGITQAMVGKGDLIRWAEPETGGEAFIPRLGNRSRSLEILKIAAGWYGQKITPMASGGVFTTAGVVRSSSSSAGVTFNSGAIQVTVTGATGEDAQRLGGIVATSIERAMITRVGATAARIDGSR